MRSPIITRTMRGEGLEEYETRRISVVDPTFGARGDGVTDDTTAIQNAINTAAVMNKAVYFPPHIPGQCYKITGILTPNARAYIGDGGDGTKTVIKQFTVDTAIFEYTSIINKRFQGLSFDADADGVYAFNQTTADAYTNHCSWFGCYFAMNIERCINANLIYSTFFKTRFGYDGIVNGNGIHQAIYSHGTAAHETNANEFFACTFAHGKGGNGYVDILRGISWQFYSCKFEVMNVAAVYAKDIYALSFPNSYFEQRIDLGSGQNYLIYLGSDGFRDTVVTTFSGIILTLQDNTDIDQFIELGHAGSRVSFGPGGLMVMNGVDITNYSGTANYGILGIDSVVLLQFDDQAKKFGFFQTGNVILTASEENPDTLVQSLDFENTYWGPYLTNPFASIQAHTGHTGANYDSSELLFYTRISTAGGMTESLRLDSVGLAHFSQATGTLILFTNQDDTMADDAIVVLPDATSGMVFVSCNGEAGMWLVQNDGTATKICGSANTADTDSDNNLCVFDGGGTSAVVKNRLGAPGEVRIFYYHQ